MSRPRLPDLVPGGVVGSRTLVAPAPNGRWIARCACGTVDTVYAHHLRNGVSRRCRKCAIARKVTHGMSGSVEHKAWVSMRGACERPTHHCYPRFGGRGIKVCERWSDFAAFYADMGECAWDRVLRRRDPDGDFSPENCYWGLKGSAL